MHAYARTLAHTRMGRGEEVGGEAQSVQPRKVPTMSITMFATDQPRRGLGAARHRLPPDEHGDSPDALRRAYCLLGNMW